MKNLAVFLFATVMAASSHAAITMTMLESGTDVVLSASGSANLTDLTHDSGGVYINFIRPSSGYFYAGPTSQLVKTYITVTAPGAFGSGGISNPTSGSGDLIGLELDYIALPSAYVSGNALSGTSTYVGESFATLGVTSGIYTWTWGSGPNEDSATLTIGTVPEPATWAAIVGVLALACALWRRRKG